METNTTTIQIQLPKTNWFAPESNIKPAYNSLCIIIYKYGSRSPRIVQYRKADYLYSTEDYFLDVSDKWALKDNYADNSWEPSFATMNIISYWKPLDLPDSENERIINDIKSWLAD